MQSFKSSFPVKVDKDGSKTRFLQELFDEKDANVRSGWSSRPDSQVSLDEDEQISKVKHDLQDYIFQAKHKDFESMKDKFRSMLMSEKD